MNIEEIKERMQEAIDKNCFIIHEFGKINCYINRDIDLVKNISYGEIEQVIDVPFTTVLGDEIRWYPCSKGGDKKYGLGNINWIINGKRLKYEI